MQDISKIKVMGAVHCGGSLDPKFAMALCGITATTKALFGLSFKIGEPVHTAVNDLTELAIAENFDYICYMDGDTTNVSFDIIDRLLMWDVDVVGAYSYNRGFPFHPNQFRLVDPKLSLTDLTPDEHVPPQGHTLQPHHGLQPIDMISTQLLLCKVAILKEIEWPWFSFEKNTLPDNYFCQKLREAGARMFCDTDYIAEHAEMNNIKRKYMIAYQEELDKTDHSDAFAPSENRITPFRERAAVPWRRIGRKQ